MLAKFGSKAEEFRAALDSGLPVLRNTTHVMQYFERTFDGTTGPLYDLIKPDVAADSDDHRGPVARPVVGPGHAGLAGRRTARDTNVFLLAR